MLCAVVCVRFTNTRRRFLVPFLNKLAKAETSVAAPAAEEGEEEEEAGGRPQQHAKAEPHGTEQWMTDGGTLLWDMVAGLSEAEQKEEEVGWSQVAVADGDSGSGSYSHAAHRCFHLLPLSASQ